MHWKQIRWLLLAATVISLTHNSSPAATQGSLISPQGHCPLKHTEVKAKISGFLARVTVTQQFENPHMKIKNYLIKSR